jgi:uridylate kinase
MEKLFVIKIGGSVLSLENNVFDFEVAEKLKTFFLSFDDSYKFILVTGGGFVARNYQQMLKLKGYSDYDQHYIGTIACNMNAVMFRSVFQTHAHKRVIALSELSSVQPLKFNEKVLIAGAGEPGPSSDWDAVHLAIKSGATKVITIKDIDAVYSEDPDKNANATKLTSVSWNDYLKIIGNPEFHKPGGNLPVDPIASKLAMQNKIKFFVVGNNLDNLRNLLNNEQYLGTEIY